MESFTKKKQSLSDWVSEHQTGLYLTLIIHLLVAILFLLFKIDALKAPKYYQVELEPMKPEKVQVAKLDVPRLTEDKANQISSASSRGVSLYKNVAVDATSKSTSKDPVYKEAEDLQKKLDATKQMQARAEQELSEMGRLSAEKSLQASANAAAKKATESAPYIGNAVISWLVQGRKAIYLPNPVYTCERGGEVEISVLVNRRGYVDEVSVSKRAGNQAPCLIEAAMKAAKQSRFTASDQDRQAGYIRYRFISQ